MPTSPDTPLTFYEFFAGVGLARMGMGSRWACLWANDKEPKKTRIYTKWFGNGHLSTAKVEDVHADDLPPDADLAWASFPCTDLSLAGWRRGLSAERSGTFWAFWRLMRSLLDRGDRPPLLVIENVPGMLYGENFRGLTEALAALGLQFGALLIDAVQFLPQSRPRVFVVAADQRLPCGDFVDPNWEGKEWFTSAVVRAEQTLDPSLRPLWRWWKLPRWGGRKPTLEDVITSIEVEGVALHTKAETQHLLDMMTPVNLKKIEEAKGRAGRSVGLLYRRTRDGEQRAEVRFDGIAGCLRVPSGGSSRQTVLFVENGTVTTRLLSPREAARLMGVPDSRPLPEQYNEAYAAMGDAVAVPVVRHLARRLLTPLAERARSANVELRNRSYSLRESSGGFDGNAAEQARKWEAAYSRGKGAQVCTPALEALIAWYDGERDSPEVKARKFVICVGLAVVEHMRENYPLAKDHVVTPGGQARAGKAIIQNILARHGIERVFAKEGGRTTRGAAPCAERLQGVLNGVAELAQLPEEARGQVCDELQDWLVERVKEYFEADRIRVQVSGDMPGPLVIESILNAAGVRDTGAVAEYLVGAKLDLRFPDIEVENRSAEAADDQAGLHGDFVVNDTVFHVTIAPSQGVIQKCQANLTAGYRPNLIVASDRFQGTKELAVMMGVADRISLHTIENFVGQNIEEMAEFSKDSFKAGLRRLFERYNERVKEVDTNTGRLIEIPPNL